MDRHFLRRIAFSACLLAPFVAGAPALAQQGAFAISGEGFQTEADVRPHNRLGLDLAEIREALAQSPPNYAAALTRYAFGKNFQWRDSAHSLAFFADDYHARMGRSLPGAEALFGDTSFQHRFMSAALMGTGLFEGTGQRRSIADPVRVAALNTGLVALVINWCRLELSEASLRGPRNGNWSLQNGSPKNWNELFAFWWGPDGQHSLHAEMTRIAQRLGLQEHPTRALTAPLAAGQPIVIGKAWPGPEAKAVAGALDAAALLLFLDRVADLEAATAADALGAARAALQGAWLAAGDSFARADEPGAKALHAAILSGKEPPKAADLRAATRKAAGTLGIDPARLGFQP